MKKLIMLSLVLSLTACASVQTTTDKLSSSFNKVIENMGKPAVAKTPAGVTPIAPAVQSEPTNVMYGKILAVKKNSSDSVTLVVQLANGATFSLPAGADAGFKKGQNVKLNQQGKQISVEAL